jgi:hypothetical protein
VVPQLAARNRSRPATLSNEAFSLSGSSLSAIPVRVKVAVAQRVTIGVLVAGGVVRTGRSARAGRVSHPWCKSRPSGPGVGANVFRAIVPSVRGSA